MPVVVSHCHYDSVTSSLERLTVQLKVNVLHFPEYKIYPSLLNIFKRSIL